MPRISPRAIRTARTLHPHLAQLLPVCRDLRSAQNELRWIWESVQNGERNRPPCRHPHGVSALVRRRARGEPLQYLLGNEFFGDLELKCRPGVLIPRPETAASVTHLVHRFTAKLTQKALLTKLQVLDVCTGTGCIPLLFHDEFYKHRGTQNIALDIRGYDISRAALGLAEENKAMQLARSQNCSNRSFASERVRSLLDMKFLHFDVLSGTPLEVAGGSDRKPEQDIDSLSAAVSDCTLSKCDILISNPPYISASEYYRTTARSVRKFEPRLALVPPAVNREKDHSGDQGDLFYPHLLDLAERLSTKLILLEVADMEQAKRVVAMVLQRSSWNVDLEIWRDEPSRKRVDEVHVQGRSIRVLGEGNGRSVFIWRNGPESFGFD